ncbi:hypothetical protein Pla175_40280 [Pirellulimonas nuda]|uniref:Uncharacterized protein n=1 Tax=Pirellulimonas nuda TaxID=2528009 RepID=A0A518DGM1_9BACT|nr:hypothetical protein [Pirellulimonas nuda]QDU90619.1 hypothetical protein Pla175_40280 [Pirellulimonas nuda]
MDSQPHSDPQADALAAASGGRLRDLRGRFASRAAERDASFQTLEDRLGAELQAIADQVSAELESERLLQSSSIEERSAELIQELDGRAQELDRAHESIESERAELAQERASLDRQTLEGLEEIEARNQELAEREQKLDETTQRLQQQSEALAQREADQAAEAAQLETSYADLERLEAEIETKLAELDARSNELADRAAQIESGESGANREVDERVARLTKELAAAQAELESFSLRLEDRDDQTSAAITVLESERDATLDEMQRLEEEAAAERASADEAIERLRADLKREAEARSKERQASAEQCEQLNASLLAAVEQRELAPSADELAALEKKFELAQQDAAGLRARLAELEAEGADPGLGESLLIELEQTRDDRDAALARIAELENAAAASGGGAADDDELRRRFEMAVDDIRQLKSEKAELEAKLLQAPVAENGSDWESQKRRMLASLEGDSSPERREERATIEGTVRITDEVVAGKDREIAQLRQALEESSARCDEACDAAAAPAPVINDAAVDAELARVEELRGQWEAKLREAELELSVERARIAREQSELAEWRIELEGMADNVRHAQQPAASGGKSQSNWMRKMGLGGGEGK